MKVNKRVLRSDNIMRTFFAASVVSFATSIVALGWLISSSPRLETADAADASIPAQASKVSVNVYDLISLSLNDEINVEITPEDVAYSRLKTSPVTSVSVSTNVPNGYILYIADLDSDTNLVNTDSASHTIAALSNIVGGSAKTWSVNGNTMDFTNNSWGYSTDYVAATNTGTFHGVEYARTQLKFTEGPATGDTTNLTIGARVDTQKAAGTYIDTIVLSAVPNSTQTTAWSNITEMQQMDSATCASAPAASSKFTATKSLIDNRDGNTYMVSKLADGNCWMTQNLALSFKDGKALNSLTGEGEIAFTNQNTDLNTKSSWAPANDTQTSTGTKWSADGNGDSSARSYAFPTGRYYVTRQEKADGTKDTSSNSFTYDSLAACMAGSQSGDIPHTSEECQHYKAGNLYNWYGAIAESKEYNASFTSGDAGDSICPKGWQLPVNNSANPKSWYAITGKYITTSMSTAEKTFAVQQAPLYLVRSGNYNYSNGSLYYQAYRMYYWSATASSATDANYLYAYPTSWNPQISDYRGNGRSVRCVAR